MNAAEHAGGHPQPLRVTFVVWQALPAIDPSRGRQIGGLETAAWAMARHLAADSRFDVHFFVRSTRGWNDRRVEGVAVHAVRDRWSILRRQVSECIDLPQRRLLRFRPRLLWQVPLLGVTRPWRGKDLTGDSADSRLIDHATDLWGTLGVSRESAAVVETARQQGRPSLLMIRSAADLGDPTAYGVPVAIQRQVLQRATRIVCQAEYQGRKLREGFGREATLIRNAIDRNRWTAGHGPRSGVLWVGRYETFHKRIDLAIKIARACPEIPFTLVANRSQPEVEAEVRAHLPANVSLVDYVPHDEMPDRFRASSVFLSTGAAAYEGFPNVLLQAAATHTPVVSLEDFDSFIQRSGCGMVAANCQAAAEAIRRNVAGETPYDWSAIDAYLRDKHSPEAERQTLAGLCKQIAGPS